MGREREGGGKGEGKRKQVGGSGASQGFRILVTHIFPSLPSGQKTMSPMFLYSLCWFTSCGFARRVHIGLRAFQGWIAGFCNM